MKKCIECGCKEELLVPIYQRGTSCGTEEDYSSKYICEECLDDSLAFGVCTYCGDEGAYSIKDLKDDCCEEHVAELPIIHEDAEDDESGWSSLADHYRDPNHW
ncbi:hypothetical protein [Lysinibacillus sp. BW-2-10]|uniref:hypothetical protein n=1 Tax=Lysinibacillus sp. BW-2-10 TaxID=2590030 RepID=UPI00117F14DC|nr:hypothetical protein [Lysinibacillus sp. BW-2-10]TSI10550.1 hypothetical protein FJQ64_03725 [Lysinibacillus sp. BW-2-10]